jgi:hypothetical protein
MPRLMLTKATIDRLAQNLQLNADSGDSPVKTPDNLDSHPYFQQLATIDDPQIKRLYALFISARDRARTIAALPEDPEANTPVSLRPHGLVAGALLQLFERAVRLRFSIPDDCNIVIDGRWRVFSFFQPEEHACPGDCSNCKQSDSCPEERRDEHECHEGHNCGPNCKSLGGTGCGRPNCSCEEPAEPVARVDIRASFEQETFIDLKAVGVCLASLIPSDGIIENDTVITKFCINEPMYRAMKQAAHVLSSLAELCEQAQDWSYEPN